ncbi:magnesium transporter [Aureibaculum marinum]|uniref:Magnesium transporter MgtE n=1 Tax=Aureibaculum marinum TaxID=2487930 RepID=A0A3N4P198_9FLAO|nr:magnesium transporter [Aureibaculum marinum]RPE00209.1 magnesium transporter [Aureibaculum marinum]
MPFEITEQLIEQITGLILNQDDEALLKLLENEHHADIAEVLEDLNLEEATYIIKLLDSDLTSEILMEMDEDDREKILQNLSEKEIAKELDELDTDDAADMIAELPEDRQQKVISNIEDKEHKADIQELLKYDENSAGGLMAKELVKVYDNWNVLKCVREMRAQAEFVTRVHSIYVVNENNQLEGRLSLKDLLTTSTKTPISEVYIPKVDYVNVHDSAEDVARVMQKYDLEAIPVVDDNMHLLGRITIDDIVDVIKEEADKDYQMAAGISQDIEADDTLWQHSRARLPWLFLGLFGGVGAAAIMGGFEEMINKHAVLFFFTPLIGAMAGNVGVQASAIIVQSIANSDLKGSIANRLFKEFSLAMVNGLALSIILFSFTWFWKKEILTSLAISISLFVVIIVAGIIGTFIPLFLHKQKIDPAIATGPFITTSNDIFGILIYFSIAKMLLGI